MKLYKNFLLKLNSRFGSKFAAGGFSHNVLLMFIGTAIGQMGSVILSPALTRIYSPEDFGVLGLYMTVTFLFSLVASFRYELAIPLTKNEEETNNMLAVCVLSLFSCSFIIAGILYLIPVLPDFLESSFGALWKYRMMIPLGVFAIGAYQICVSYATHKQTYKAISQTKIYQGYGGPISQIILGLLGANIWGMIIGFIIGQSLGVSMLVRRLIGSPKQIIPSVSWKKIKASAWRFRNFPLISTFSVLIGVLGGETLLIIVISTLYDSTAVIGFIFLISRIIGRPLFMISTSILQVYTGDASKTQTTDPKAMLDRFLKVVGFQFIIVSSWLAVINATAWYFIPVVFGEKWTECVPYIYILSIAYLPQITLHAVTNTLQILEKQKLSAIFDIAKLAVIICVFAFSYLYGLTVTQLLLAYCITQALASLVMFMLMYRAISTIRVK